MSDCGESKSCLVIYEEIIWSYGHFGHPYNLLLLLLGPLELDYLAIEDYIGDKFDIVLPKVHVFVTSNFRGPCVGMG